jgi:hypothetical protein
MHERPTTQNGDHDPEPVEPDEDYEPHEREERAEVFEEAEDAKREAERRSTVARTGGYAATGL